MTATSPSPTLTMPQPGATMVLERAGIVLVYAPAGEFLMGSTDADVEEALALCQHYQSNCERSWFSAEQSQQRVYLDAYWIGQTEVTNAQYRRFIAAGGYTQREHWSAEGWQWRETNGITQPMYWDDDLWTPDDHPVVGVSWYEAEAFAHWAGARLPSEAQWEKAARGTGGGVWPWGDEWDGHRANLADVNSEYDWRDDTVDDGYRYTSPVGNYPAGASPYGALDVAGNVWEWVADWYVEGYSAAGRNPSGPDSGRYRVIRGGSWNYAPYALRCATRGRLEPHNRSSALGLRVVVSGAGLAPPLPHSMKGYELYSWQASGQWHFALLTGTNRLKTLEEITTGEDMLTADGWVRIHVQGIDALQDLLRRLPPGEMVFWASQESLARVHGPAAGITLPPQAVVDLVQEHCRQLGLVLYVR